MTLILPTALADTPNLDGFSRLRVSQPQTVFDAQLTYNLQPLLYEQIVTGEGASVGHDTTNRAATMTFAATPTGGQTEMRTFEHFRYQPGKSQLVFITFNMNGGVANTVKYAGYSDGSNGIEFAMVGATPTIRLLSDTGHGDESWQQSTWNLDKLDGTGPSGAVLDLTKTQILVIDFQALYTGRVRVGFDIDGDIVYAVEASHANKSADPYIQTANLPVRVGMTCTGTVSTTMQFICCSVISEGGQDDTTGYQFSVEGTATAASSARTHLLSVRPASTYNSIVNRSKFVLESVDVVVTGNQPVKWELILGEALTDTTTFNAVNATYSGFEYNTAGTTAAAPAVVVAQGYVAASATQKAAVSQRIPMRYPITLNAAGAPRALGTLTVLATGIGGTSATRATLNWKEIR